MVERGFKARASRLAVEIRSEFGLKVTDVFDPYEYFSAYGVPILELSSLEVSDMQIAHQGIRDKFSGALISTGSGVMVLDNDWHPRNRRRSTTTHEAAHHILEHAFATAISVEERKCGLAREQEDEADILAGELLIPFEAAKRHATAGWSDWQVADLYEVSIEFARWRMGASGARKYAASVKKYRSR